MDLPSLPDAVVGAVLAAAIGLLGQSLVKVWEVRQRRMDDVARMYADRIKNVRVSVLASHRFTETDSALASAALAWAEASDRFQAGDRTAPVLPTKARHDQLSEEQDARRRELEARVEALTESDALFNLYARAPLQRRDRELLDQLDAMFDNPSAGYSAVDAAATRWVQYAKWELRSIGSIGPAYVAYGLVTLWHGLLLSPLDRLRGRKTSADAYAAAALVDTDRQLGTRLKQQRGQPE